MAKKRKTLPKNFSKLIEAGDINELKAVFDTCEINAYCGYNKETALSSFNIPEELVRWLVAKGADINAADATYKRTALHLHAMRRSGKIDVFLELGADVNAVDRYGDTPLHFAAASSYNPEIVRSLLAYGANPLAKNNRGDTPLVEALACANNIDIENLVEISTILLKTEISITPSMQESVIRIGKDFEFHRENFNPDSVDSVDAALSRLYKIYEVAPVEKRRMHDGVSPIIVPPGKPLEQYNILWKLLIPSQGAAKTVQGEVIRITGRIHDELFRNGGANWDADYRKMLDALLTYFASGTALEDHLLDEATVLAKQLRRSGDGNDEPVRLCELAVKWVIANPDPVILVKPKYGR